MRKGGHVAAASHGCGRRDGVKASESLGYQVHYRIPRTPCIYGMHGTKHHDAEEKIVQLFMFVH
jgi:hypothetical protein